MHSSTNHSKPLIVGLAGPTGAGKSTAARRAASRLNGHVISMESYSISKDHLPLEQRAKVDYDAPEAIDVDLLTTHIRQFATGNAIDAPIYDFAEHLRAKGRFERFSVKPLLIVEGILALHFPQLRSNFDLTIYLDVPDATCFHRRRVRDITERQRSLELIKWQYETTVLPAQRDYLMPSKRYANVIIDGTSEPAIVAENLTDTISKAITLRDKAAPVSV